jgi:phage terminase large subunit
MSKYKIEVPPKIAEIFEKPRGYYRYRGAFGGRGSGKSMNFALMAAIFAFKEELRILCTREIQASIKESFHAELKNAIRSQPWLEKEYEIGKDFLRCKRTGSEFLFKGLRHNIQAIKSTSGIDICIIEEAEDVPEESLVDLEPTIRKEKSELWFIWNPRTEGSPVDRRFRKENDPDAKIVEMNYYDNPFFPEVLERQRLRDMRLMSPEKYAHIWEGKYLQGGEANVFSNKWEVKDFEPNFKFDGPYFGLDFGFAQDPTAAVKCWIYDNCLYIEKESGKVGLELDFTANYIKKDMPEIEQHIIRADNARPESISFLRRNGLHKIVACEKGKGSIEDGVEYIKSFDRVYIHSRCKETINEFLNYSYKIDRYTGDVLPVIIDAWNHYIDALRYALEPAMKRNKINYSKLI